jgi:hypothetical protein
VFVGSQAAKVLATVPVLVVRSAVLPRGDARRTVM